MIFYKESKKFLTEENIDYIENTILSPSFPFYLSKSSTSNDDCKVLFHILVKRPEEMKEKNRINSEHYPQVLNLVKSFFNKFGIRYCDIVRMCINFSYNNGIEKCPVHQDHEFPHKQLIIYLNDPDPSSKTIILDKKGKVLKEISPEKYKGFCFDNLPHYHFYPKKRERIVLVTTFV